MGGNPPQKQTKITIGKSIGEYTIDKPVVILFRSINNSSASLFFSVQFTTTVQQFKLCE